MADYLAVVMAAGKGTRMKSSLPKVMHRIAGKPLIDHVIDKLILLGIKNIVTVIGHGRHIVEEHIRDRSAVVIQEQQLGTGHALMQAAPCFGDKEQDVIVLSGDQPLLTTETLRSLLETHHRTGAAATVLTADMENPFGYGRIVKENGIFKAIVEEKDADSKQKKIKEINTGTYCFKSSSLQAVLAQLSPQNVQGEYYLTDVFQIFMTEGQTIATYCTTDPQEALGINNRIQLAEAEEILHNRIRNHWMEEGVTIINPASVIIEADAVLEKDIVIHPFSLIKGRSYIEEESVIGPGTTIESSTCRRGCTVEHSVAREAVIGRKCNIGPYAYLRPGTVLGDSVKVGDFVEIKNSQIGEGSKIPHLSYIGDSELGKNVNIGAGTITCNYDGKNKHQTIIGDHAFVGSNTNFVAPVHIGEDAVIGAGSTITKDVPDEALAIERSQQKNIINRRKTAKEK